MEITFTQYQIMMRLRQYYFNRDNYHEGYTLWVSVFGAPNIFYKIGRMARSARELICPHCGKKGLLAAKTTVSKKKYIYKKLYLYHETFPIRAKTSLRIQKWCYLNENDLNSPVVKRKIHDWVRAQNIAEYFYKSLILP